MDIFLNDMPEMREMLEKVNEHIERLCYSNNPSMKKMMEYVLLSRGKQLRPLLTLLCASLKGKKIDVAEVAAVIEICHTASLIHDDIIDDADKRRGRLSLQTKFGKEMAVYAGDFMIFSAIGRTKLTNKLWYKDMFAKLECMCDGEVSQYDHIHDINITEEEYLENIIGKTCALFEIACVSGAREGGCNKIEREAIDNFARYFGLSFQIRDDLLDFVSNSEATGKTIHNDFWTGYYTLPAIHTFANIEYGHQLRTIAKELKENKTQTEELNQKIHSLIEKSAGFTHTYNLFKQYIQFAKESLDVFDDSKYKSKLLDIVDYIDFSVDEMMKGII